MEGLRLTVIVLLFRVVVLDAEWNLRDQFFISYPDILTESSDVY